MSEWVQSGCFKNLFIFPFEWSLRTRAHNCLSVHGASKHCLCSHDLTGVRGSQIPQPKLLDPSLRWLMANAEALRLRSLQQATLPSYLSLHTCLTVFLRARMRERLGDGVHQLQPRIYLELRNMLRHGKDDAVLEVAFLGSVHRLLIQTKTKHGAYAKSIQFTGSLVCRWIQSPFPGPLSQFLSCLKPQERDRHVLMHSLPQL